MCSFHRRRDRSLVGSLVGSHGGREVLRCVAVLYRAVLCYGTVRMVRYGVATVFYCDLCMMIDEC